MNKVNLNRLIAPKSIAVVGNRGADFAIRESKKLGFTGKIWAVHPTLEAIEGITCYKNVRDLPEAPDATFIAVNADTAIDVVADLKFIGGGGAVLYASGFGEVGESGVIRNQKLIEAADGLPIIGPNCYGFINSLDRVALWPDVQGCEPLKKGVAIITQSGNIGLNMTMQSIGLPIAYMFTVGNQTNTSISDIIHAMLDDDRVNAIGIHIEGINDIEAFDDATRRALHKKIPIVAIKSGRTQSSAKIALSHTSSMSGSDELFSSFFERQGIARVETVPEFLETLKLLSIIGPISHNGVASMSCSGGEAGMMADLIDGLDIAFKSLDEDHKRRVRATLNEYVEVDNPLDYHTFIWGNLEKTSACFKEMISGGFAATMLLLDWPKTDVGQQQDWDKTFLALCNAIKDSGEKAIVLSSMADCMPKRIIEQCHDYGIVPMIGLDSCLKSLNHSYNIGLSFKRSELPPLKVSRLLRGESNNKLLTEYEAKSLISKYGISVPEGSIVSSYDEAHKVAEKLIYPVTVKISSETLAHKTELNAVRINIRNSEMLETACKDLLKIGPLLLVEKMIEGSIAELIIGMNHDPIFGKFIVIGSGGVLVELLQDSCSLLLPLKRKDILDRLSKLKVYPILQGYRGKSGGDIEAIIDSVLSIAELILANDIAELDINPLLVMDSGQGVVAVDALIKLN